METSSNEPSALVIALKALEELGYPGLAFSDLSRLHPSDNFQIELEVMADVRAYFQVSFKVSLRTVHILRRWEVTVIGR